MRRGIKPQRQSSYLCIPHWDISTNLHVNTLIHYIYLVPFPCAQVQSGAVILCASSITEALEHLCPYVPIFRTQGTVALRSSLISLYTRHVIDLVVEILLCVIELLKLCRCIKNQHRERHTTPLRMGLNILYILISILRTIHNICEYILTM